MGFQAVTCQPRRQRRCGKPGALTATSRCWDFEKLQKGSPVKIRKVIEAAPRPAARRHALDREVRVLTHETAGQKYAAATWEKAYYGVYHRRRGKFTRMTAGI